MQKISAQKSTQRDRARLPLIANLGLTGQREFGRLLLEI
jgi:hypothetical protein